MWPSPGEEPEAGKVWVSLVLFKLVLLVMVALLLLLVGVEVAKEARLCDMWLLEVEVEVEVGCSVAEEEAEEEECIRLTSCLNTRVGLQ